MQSPPLRLMLGDMGFCAKWVLPRLADLAMRNREATRYRSQIEPRAYSTILGIGIGSGLNLPFYAVVVEQLYGFDPPEERLAMAGKKRTPSPSPSLYTLMQARKFLWTMLASIPW